MFNVILYPFQIGDSWTDGLCHKFQCVSGSGTTPPLPLCLPDVCDSIRDAKDAKDYELVEKRVAFECCPKSRGQSNNSIEADNFFDHYFVDAVVDLYIDKRTIQIV